VDGNANDTNENLSIFSRTLRHLSTLPPMSLLLRRLPGWFGEDRYTVPTNTVLEAHRQTWDQRISKWFSWLTIAIAIDDQDVKPVNQTKTLNELSSRLELNSFTRPTGHKLTNARQTLSTIKEVPSGNTSAMSISTPAKNVWKASHQHVLDMVRTCLTFFIRIISSSHGLTFMSALVFIELWLLQAAL
jgi:hypothetical protein